MLDAILVTGFLGAGKTTLIERALLPRLLGAGMRPALLINDAGAFNYDALRLGGAGVPLWQVTGGCGCCAVAGRLAEALHALVQTDARPLVIEGSGLSDPQPLLQALRAEGLYRIGVLGVVFGPGPIDRWRAEPLARAQLQAADLIVIAAADELGAGEYQAVDQALAGLSPAPRLRLTQEGLLPADWWERLGALGSQDSHLSARPQEVRFGIRPHDDWAVRSEPLPGWYRRETLTTWLRALPRGVLRVKGVAQIIGCPVSLGFDSNGIELAFHRLSTPASPQWFAVGRDAAVLQGLKPPLPVPSESIDWQDESLWLPLGAADGRIEVAWEAGQPIAPQAAARRVLDRWRRRRPDEPVVVSPSWAAELGAVTWGAEQTPTEALCSAIAECRAQNAQSRLFALDLPWPWVEAACLATGWPTAQVIHLGRRWSSPRAALSLAMVEPRALIEALLPMGGPSLPQAPFKGM